MLLCFYHHSDDSVTS